MEEVVRKQGEVARKVVRARKPKRRSQAERSRAMRKRLLEAATVVLRRNGYAGLRTEEVSRVAGVSRGAQLHHFPTKESLVLSTTEHIFKASTDRSLGRATGALASSDPVEEIIRDGMDFFFSDDFFVLLDLVLMGDKNRKIREHIYSVARTHRPAVEEAWLTVLQKSGMERQRAETVLWLTLSVVRGLAIRSLWQPDPKLFRRLLDEWKALISARFSAPFSPRGSNGRRAGVDVPLPTRRKP
jgi:AcrR family transcriptional regulator